MTKLGFGEVAALYQKRDPVETILDTSVFLRDFFFIYEINGAVCCGYIVQQDVLFFEPFISIWMVV